MVPVQPQRCSARTHRSASLQAEGTRQQQAQFRTGAAALLEFRSTSVASNLRLVVLEPRQRTGDLDQENPLRPIL